MAIRIETTTYVRSHMKEPKGKGSWGFIIEASHGHEEHTIFSPSDCTYREACRWARRQVRYMGFQDANVQVAP